MAMIPEELYQTVERKRRERRTAIKRAREQVARARAKAGSTPGGIMVGDGRRTGGGSSRTEKAALAVVAAEKKLEKVMKWEAVFKQLDEIFPYEETEEGYIAGRLYDQGAIQADISRERGTDRQTIRRRKDIYIFRLILLATAAGLISPGDIRHSEGR